MYVILNDVAFVFQDPHPQPTGVADKNGDTSAGQWCLYILFYVWNIINNRNELCGGKFCVSTPDFSIENSAVVLRFVYKKREQ